MKHLVNLSEPIKNPTLAVSDQESVSQIENILQNKQTNKEVFPPAHNPTSVQLTASIHSQMTRKQNSSDEHKAPK